MASRRPRPGIRVRHAAACPKTNRGARCTCTPTYEASVGAGKRGRKLRKTFRTEAAALTWQGDARRAVESGTHREPSRVTVREAAALMLAGMRLAAGEPLDKTGSDDELALQARAEPFRTRSGTPYKPSVIRGYESSLRLYVLDGLGGMKLGEVRKRDVQALANRLLARGLDASTVRNALMPLRVLYREAVHAEQVATSPCAGVRLPAVEGKRERIATPDEAARLIAALRPSDRALWASAFYGGLRAGELRALRWEHIDLGGGVIRVVASMDAKGATVAPKSKAGRRKVPMPGPLRDLLAEHKLVTWNSGYVFGSSAGHPFTHSAVMRRARLRWGKVEPLKPLADFGLHEARHTYASMAIQAGVNAKALSTYMGHSSITITLDRYGHLMPGNESEFAALFDGYLARADTASRLRQVGGAAA
jgi:integrase